MPTATSQSGSETIRISAGNRSSGVPPNAASYGIGRFCYQHTANVNFFNF